MLADMHVCVFVVDMLNVYILCNNWRKIAMAMMVKDILYIVMQYATTYQVLYVFWYTRCTEWVEFLIFSLVVNTNNAPNHSNLYVQQY